MTNTNQAMGVKASSEGIKKIQQSMAELVRPDNTEKRGWTQSNLAERSGVDLSTVKRFLKGNPIRPDCLSYIAEAVGLKSEDVIEISLPELQEVSLDWLSICGDVLDKQRDAKELRRKATGMGAENNVYMPLDLIEVVEKKQDQSVEGNDKQAKGKTEKIIHPHAQFLEDLLNWQRENKHIAIAGEAGAGKTTFLVAIAEKLKDSQFLPIFIGLADLQGRSLKTYINDVWLPRALNEREATEEQKESLFQQFQTGKIWLLLDALDEMQAKSSTEALDRINREIKEVIGQSRVVMTCRLNVWDAHINRLPNFDTFRMGDLSPEQVDSFINQWFSFAERPESAPILQEKLNEPNRDRIRDTVTHPLRLALLCQAFYRNPHTDLPETEAGLYELFVRYFYEWKPNIVNVDLRTQDSLREELHQALGKLAISAIGSDAGFRLSRSFAVKAMDNSDLFNLACNVGWLSLIDRNDLDEEVYSFFHATFQEYFAALTVDQDFFLPKNHVDQPVEGGRYRLFEAKWRKVLTIWLGRSDVSKDDRLNFKKCLKDFQSGVGDPDYYDDFYSDSAQKIANIISDEGDFNKEKPSSYQAKLKPIEEKNERNSRYCQPTYENIDAAISKLIAMGLANSLDQLKLPINEIADLYYSLGLDPAQIAPEILNEWRESNYFSTPFNYLVSRYIKFEKEEETRLIGEQFFKNLEDSIWCTSDLITSWWHNSAKYSVALGKSWRAFDDLSNRELDLLINLSSEEVDAIYENAKRQLSDNEKVVRLLAENQAIKTVLGKYPIVSDWLRETCHTIKNIFTDDSGKLKQSDYIVQSIRQFTITNTLNLIKEGKYSLEETSQGKLSLDYRFEMFASLKDFFEMESSDISLITQEVIDQFNQAKDSILSDAIAAFRNSEEDIDTQFKTIERLNNFRTVKFLDGCHFNPSVDQQFNQIKEQTLSDEIALLQKSTRDISVQLETIKKLNDFRQTYFPDNHDLQPETIEAWHQVKEDIFGNAINLCKDIEKDIHDRLEILQALSGLCENQSVQGSPLNQILFEILLSMQPEMLGADTTPYNSKDWTYARFKNAISYISELYDIDDGIEIDGLDFIYDLVKDLSAEYYPQISDLLIKLHLTLVQSNYGYSYSGTDGNSNPAFDTINRLASEKPDFNDYFVDIIEKTRPQSYCTGYTLDFDLAHYLKPESRVKYLYDELTVGYSYIESGDVHICVISACIYECKDYKGNRDICEVIIQALKGLYVDDPSTCGDSEGAVRSCIESLESIMTPDLYPLVISHIRPLYSCEPKDPHNNRKDPRNERCEYFGELICTISQDMSYPEFYKLWHSYDSEVTTSPVETPPLNETELLQLLENQFIDLNAVQKEIDRTAKHPEIRCVVVDVRDLEQESDLNVIAEEIAIKIFDSLGREIPEINRVSNLKRELINLKRVLGVEELAIALYGKRANEAIHQLCQSLSPIQMCLFTGEQTSEQLTNEVKAWLRRINLEYN